MLYHRDVLWNDDFDRQAKELIVGEYTFSRHLKEHLKKDKYKKSYNVIRKKLNTIIKQLQQTDIKPFEVEVIDNKVTKCVVRTVYNKNEDISIVFRKGVVITFWLNQNTDKHENLKVENYRRI